MELKDHIAEANRNLAEVLENAELWRAEIAANEAVRDSLPSEDEPVKTIASAMHSKWWSRAGVFVGPDAE